MIATYTAHKINLDGTLSHKELLNNNEEMREWVSSAYGRFASIRIANDQTGEIRQFTDNGKTWERIA
jgi:hypothetical protein